LGRWVTGWSEVGLRLCRLRMAPRRFGRKRVNGNRIPAEPVLTEPMKHEESSPPIYKGDNKRLVNVDLAVSIRALSSSRFVVVYSGNCRSEDLS